MFISDSALVILETLFNCGKYIIFSLPQIQIYSFYGYNNNVFSCYVAAFEKLILSMHQKVFAVCSQPEVRFLLPQRFAWWCVMDFSTSKFCSYPSLIWFWHSQVAAATAALRYRNCVCPLLGALDACSQGLWCMYGSCRCTTAAASC